MNIKDLETFEAVVEEQSITRASKKLYITPQGVSKIIKNLEKECGCVLFVRTAHGQALTEAGERFAKYAMRVRAEHHAMLTDMLRIRQKEHGVVDLISAYGILRLLTPDCILDFKRKYPDIEFHYREYPDRQVERLFQEREGNVAFSIADFEEGCYDVSEIETFPIRLLVNTDHPLSQRKSVTIEDLRGEPLFIESSQFKIHHLIVERCREAGFKPNIIFETSGFSLCHKMVKAGKGISVTVDFVFDDMKADGLVMIPFSDGEYQWKACMLTRKGEKPGEAVELFVAHVREWLSLIRTGVITR
ncbi:LysR family transcriptional regulator [Roseburia hominis]